MKLQKRSFVTLALIAAALAALVLADVELLRVFVDERAGVERAAADERALIVSDIRAVWRSTLAQTVAEQRARIATVENDPLAPEEGLIVGESGQQLVPRTATWFAGDGDDFTLYQAILKSPADAGDDQPDDDDNSFVSAADRVGQATGAQFAAKVRAFLELRANVETSPDITAATTLAVIDALLAHDADPDLLRALLADGRDVGASRIAPVSLDLLRARAHGELTRADGVALWNVYLAHCAAAHVDCSTADARWRELDADTHIAIPPSSASLGGPVVGPHDVYFESGESKGVVGIRIDQAKVIRAIVDGATRRGSLKPSDSFVIEPVVTYTHLDDVPVSIRAQRLDDDVAGADLRFHLKTGLLGAMSFMAVGLVAAALIDRSRRRRFELLRSSFVAAVSHELRTPLASMRLLVESMLVGASDAKAQERLERLGRDVDGLDFLVENILSFSRLERGKLVPKKERAWLGEIAADAVERCRSEARATPVAIAIDIVDDNAVDVDPELAGLVVANLVRNAWQHNPRRARSGASVRVRVDVDVSGRAARVVVEDDGPGVSEADRARIFEEFERGSRPASRGTGLGLALCRQIAHAHSGNVTLETTSPTGSRFVFTLPLARDMR
jgi:signal transduction histidine kinase